MPTKILAAAVDLVVSAICNWLFGKVGDEVRRRRAQDEQEKATAEMMAALAAANTEDERRRATERIARGSF